MFYKIIIIFLISIYPTSYSKNTISYENLCLFCIQEQYLRKIQTNSILTSDSDNLLEKNLKKINYYKDSICCYNLNNKNYFFWRYKNSNKNCLFYFEESSHKVKIVKNSCLDFDLFGIDFIYIFSNKLFVTSVLLNQKDDILSTDCLKLLDDINFSFKDSIVFKKNSLIEKMYIKENKLYVKVQPKKTRINIFYYLFFWAPRGRSPNKYDIIDDGNKWMYVIDNNFKLIEKKELKAK